MRRVSSSAVLCALLLAAAGYAGCHGSPSYQGGTPPTADSRRPASLIPTLRLYVLTTLAGALEPCGCTKDELGGVQHLAAYISDQAAAAPASLVVGAGPMLFLEPRLRNPEATQERLKAEAMAAALKGLRLAAWAPGFNDWSEGSGRLRAYSQMASAALVAGNLKSDAIDMPAAVVREVGGIKVGIVGVSDPKSETGRYPDGLKAASALEAVKAGIREAKSQGARILVALCALPRGEALRLADNVPELHVLVVGKPVETGEANDAPRAPVLAGSTLVVEAANHAQTFGVVDLFVQRSVEKAGEDAPIRFSDAGGLARAEELLTLSRRIRELEARVASWERDATVRPEDLAARRADLDRLRAEKAKLEADKPALQGSFFRYQSVEVRERLGTDKGIATTLEEYYRHVNDHNRVAYKDRTPVSAEPGKPSYVGVDACTTCHEDARHVWDSTPHARAYPTLERQFKQFNLDCVSCHVTGYDKPGGSTVTFNAKLQNVQCENCHGPGSLHAKSGDKKDVVSARPPPAVCLGCHHPPHVEGFDPLEKRKLILGPGHGFPTKAPGDSGPH